MSEKPLRRTRNDLIITGVLTAVALIAVVSAWATAPIRGSELTPAPEPFVATTSLTNVPENLEEIWQITDTTPGTHLPVTSAGVIITSEGNTLRAHTPDGQVIWTYERDVDLCALSAGFDAAVATYRTGVGCGDVVAINATDGQYKATRSSNADDEVTPIASNDHVGTVGPERVELWRSDMVRTVEYGEVEAEQEANQQPFPECSITSAMTRKELLAVTENCPDGGTFLRLQPTTPEDARMPDVTQSVALQSPDARLVAIGTDSAAVYVENPTPTIVSYNNDGVVLHEQPVDEIDFPAPPFSQATADLPHHMSWFNGSQLMLFSPDTLALTLKLDDAIGTGIAVDGSLLYPVVDGIAVTNWDTGEVSRIIPVNRGGFEGPVFLGLAGETIVEKRGSELVGLTGEATPD